MTFVVSIGDDIDVVAQTDPAQSPRRYGCVLSGLQASAALISHGGDQEGVAVELTPSEAGHCSACPRVSCGTSRSSSRMWSGPSAASCGNCSRTPPDGRSGSLSATPSSAAWRVTASPAPELRFAWEAVVASGGEVSVRDLADETGWSRQHLARRFRGEFGLTPKLAARVVRFERAREMLRLSPPFVSIAQVAAVCGYYDQAHLNRDFAALVAARRPNCSPEMFHPSKTAPVTLGHRCRMTTTTNTITTTTAVWPCLTYRDARGAITFLTDVFGFRETAVHAREDDPSIIEHAELRLPHGGGVMLGTAAKDESAWGRRAPGNDAVYVVCDEPETLFDRAVAMRRRDRSRSPRRGLRLTRVHGPRHRGQPVELRHLPGRGRGAQGRQRDLRCPAQRVGRRDRRRRRRGDRALRHPGLGARRHQRHHAGLDVPRAGRHAAT